LLRNSRIGGFCALAQGEEIIAGLGLAQTRYVAFTASTEWRGFAEV